MIVLEIRITVKLNSAWIDGCMSDSLSSFREHRTVGRKKNA